MARPPSGAWASARQGFSNALRTPTFLAALAAPVVGLGAAAVESRFRVQREAKDKMQAFRSMMDLHPHLKQRDPGEVNRIFNSLHNVSPTMSRDPMVAGAWVDNVIESKGIGYNSHQGLLTAVKELSGIEKNLVDIQGRAPDPGGRWSAGVKDVASRFEDAQTRGIGVLMDRGRAEFKDREQQLRDKNKEFRGVLAKATKIVADRENALNERENAFNAREQGAKTGGLKTELGELFERLGV